MTNTQKEMLKQIPSVAVDKLTTVAAYKQVFGVSFDGQAFDYEFLEQIDEAYKQKGINNFKEEFNNYVAEFNKEYSGILKEAAKGIKTTTKKQQTARKERDILEENYMHDDKGRATQPYDEKVAQSVINHNHVIFINNRPYVYNNGVYKLDKDGKLVKEFIKGLLLDKDKKAKTINGIYTLIKDNPCISFKYEEVNKYPKHWINFKNGMLDPKTLEMTEHSPTYLSINQIPHNYDPAAVYKGSIADIFVRDIVPDKADRNMFYTYFGYCMTRETFLQKFLVLVGAPGTGKSTLLNLAVDTIGEENICAIELSQINKQFMSTFLVGNLVNICADLPKKPLESVDVIKRITGEDLIKCEIKGGDVFTTRLYLKLAFSTNEMPISLDEQSNAWYRRLLMLEVPRKGKHIENLNEGLKKSIPGFIALCVKRLNELLNTSSALRQIDSPNSLHCVAEYHHDSDSVQSWLDDCCERVQGEKTYRTEAYQLYSNYCFANELNKVSNQNFYKRMQSKGFENGRDSNGRYLKNLRIVTEKCQYLEKKCQENDTNFKQVDINNTPFKGIFAKK